MGLIKAAAEALTGGLADQWLEVIEPFEMSDTTVFTRGVKTGRERERERDEPKGKQRCDFQWISDPCV